MLMIVDVMRQVSVDLTVEAGRLTKPRDAAQAKEYLTLAEDIRKGADAFERLDVMRAVMEKSRLSALKILTLH